MRFLFVISLLALAALAAAPAASAKRLTKCQKLARDYEDLSKAKAFVVVRVDYRGARRRFAVAVCRVGRSAPSQAHPATA